MTKNITCIILDDEQLAIDTLNWQVEEFLEGIDVKATFTNPKKAIEYIQSNEIELCFLDIDMPEMTGFEFLKTWNYQPPFDFIFTTAYSQYAIDAFKVSAFNYLLKPIDEEDLVTTIKKYKEQKKSTSVSEQLSILMHQIKKPESFPKRIALPTLEGIHMVDPENIVRLEADNNYTSIHLIDNRTIIVSKTLKEIDSMLDPSRYFRIHQSHTIDVQKIKMYQRGRGGSVTMKDGTLLPVSKNKKEALLSLLGL